MSIDPDERPYRGATGDLTSTQDRASARAEKAGDWWRQNQATSSPAKPSTHDAGQPREAATDLIDKAKETARSTAKAVSSQAAELAGNIGSELTETAEEQKSHGADAMRGFAKAVHGAANELDGQSPTVARYVRRAAESVEGLSDTIRSRSVKDLITTASETARTHPAAFFIGSVAAGFALSRFFKSSSKTSVADAAGGVRSAEGLADTPKQIPDAISVAREGAGGFGAQP